MPSGRKENWEHRPRDGCRQKCLMVKTTGKCSVQMLPLNFEKEKIISQSLHISSEIVLVLIFRGTSKENSSMCKGANENFLQYLITTPPSRGRGWELKYLCAFFPIKIKVFFIMFFCSVGLGRFLILLMMLSHSLAELIASFFPLKFHKENCGVCCVFILKNF